MSLREVRQARYLASGVRSVQGWLYPFSARFIASISDIQHSAGYRGSIAEIGVHHGKLFALLHAGADPGTASLAIDVFDRQSLNKDASGRGDLAKFMQTVAKWTDPASVEVIQESSLDLTVEDLRARTSPSRLFSVDGGHTADCVLHDLMLADGHSADHGVVIADDVFNECWPEVSVAFHAFLQGPDCNLRPFAITPNKVFLCRPQYLALYRRALADRWGDMLEKTATIHGELVDLFGIKHSLRPLRRSIKRLLGNTPILPLIQRLKGRV